TARPLNAVGPGDPAWPRWRPTPQTGHAAPRAQHGPRPAARTRSSRPQARAWAARTGDAHASCPPRSPFGGLLLVPADVPRPVASARDRGAHVAVALAAGQARGPGRLLVVVGGHRWAAFSRISAMASASRAEQPPSWTKGMPWTAVSPRRLGRARPWRRRACLRRSADTS